VTVDGKIYEEEVINHRGSPRNPFRWSDEERKFYNNIYNTRFYPSGKEIIDAVRKLEGQDIRYLTNLLY
jgi:2-methylcitrate dehydratase PrpD